MWELQAPGRARPVAGDAQLADQFIDIRQQVLCQQRSVDFAAEVRNVRARMREQLTVQEPFKHANGALVDIGFVAQLGLLERATDNPLMALETNGRRQLIALGEIGWISPDKAHCLDLTHCALTTARHLAKLTRNGSLEMPDLLKSWSICQKFLS